MRQCLGTSNANSKGSDYSFRPHTNSQSVDPHPTTGSTSAAQYGTLLGECSHCTGLSSLGLTWTPLPRTERKLWTVTIFRFHLAAPGSSRYRRAALAIELEGRSNLPEWIFPTSLRFVPSRQILPIYLNGVFRYRGASFHRYFATLSVARAG